MAMVVQSSGRLSVSTVVVVVALLGRSYGLQHMVGDSVWSIPPNKDFYCNWSSSHFFQIGDTLLFDFVSEFHNVMQVSRREYESCTANNPFRAFMVGPANVPLVEEGVFYFICSVANYCALGQKLSVTVHQRYTNSPPTSSPLPFSVPVSPSLVPFWSPEPPVGASNRPQPPVHAPVANGYHSEAPAAVDWSLSLVRTRSCGVSSTGLVLFGWASALCLVVFLVVG